MSSHFRKKTQWQIIWRGSGPHVGAHPYGHQHCCTDLNLGEDLGVAISFCFPDFGLYLLNDFDFSLIASQ